ncbi:hypothetical protein [Terrisporobacter mayombei]|uniref:Uncharacterized protein n=1 Tax=Terrisporobacter mayombei TaxID=1541 RepID=A0ABY9Q0E5_9FIRM|nr:hypothetical protein [Terrisporobacter mayombei]MCC3866647.1 hypothetical protein [Terrisporobacter mayombei]WMT80884.1 hypothetical protein TEMA_12060 [Terrisporobacter mayombei]
MVIYVNLKKIGGRNKKIEKKEFHLENTPKTTRELITEVVKTSVKNYVEEKEKLIDYLELNEIKDKAQVGKVANNSDFDDRLPDLQSAIENALLSFEDEIVRIFLEDEELKNLDEKINLKENSNITFIKMTMLSGGMW